MSSFQELVQQALFPVNNDQRSQAEQQLLQMRASDYNNYLIESIKIVIDKNQKPEIRQAASTLIKGSAAIIGQNNQLNWDNVQPAIKEHAKAAILEVLIDKEPLARKAAANVLSTLLSIELPRNNWADIIQKLAQNADNENLTIRATAIQTLGQICEKLNDSNNQGIAFQLQDNVIESILMGIIKGMKQDQTDANIKVESINALKNALGYLQTYLEREQARTFVFNQVLFCLVEKNGDVILQALQCLIEFVKSNFKHLGTQCEQGNYISQIFKVVQPHLTCGNEDLVIPATEIFNSIAEEYLVRIQNNQNSQTKVGGQVEFNQNFLSMIKQELLQTLLQNLLVRSQDDEDSYESEIQKTTTQSLQNIFEALGQDSIEITKLFISNTVMNENPNYRQASCLAFNALLNCKCDDQLSQLVIGSFNVFVNLLKDQNMNVVFSTSSFLAQSADVFGDILLRSNNLANELDIITKSLQHKTEISKNICYFFCFLSEHLKTNRNSPFMNNITVIIEELTKNALRQDAQDNNDLSLIDCSFMGIMNILHNSQLPQIAAQYLQKATQQFQSCDSLPAFKVDHTKIGILACIHGAILCLEQEITNNQQSYQDAKPVILQIYNLILNHFQNKKDVDSDGIYVISAIATCLKKDFTSLIDQTWPYIDVALKKSNDLDLFKATVGCIADISRSCESGFESHIDILEKLIASLKIPDFDRELKLHVYMGIADIILSVKQKVIPQKDQLFEVFNLGFEATKYLLQTDVVDQVEYAEQLQDKLIDCYTCFLHGCNDGENSNGQSNVQNFFLNEFSNLFNFIQVTTDTKYKPAVDYIRSCLTLIADIASFYKQNVAQYVKSPLTEYLIQQLNQFANDSDNVEMIKYAKKVIMEI